MKHDIRDKRQKRQRTMKINREKALAAFQEYTDRYDSSRDMIRLKIEHTYRVCGLCQQIARSLDLPEEEVDIAWLTGLLHDVGRFEQQRVYGTFTDAGSYPIHRPHHHSYQRQSYGQFHRALLLYRPSYTRSSGRQHPQSRRWHRSYEHRSARLPYH